MNQLYNKAAVSIHDDLIDALGDRIDPWEIAARVVDAIEEEWSTVNEDMCLEFWELALNDFYRNFVKLARRLSDPASEE